MEVEPLPLNLSPCSSGRRSSSFSNSTSNSPEFEFWMVRNPSFLQPNLPSADELFSGGVLLPLHLRQLSNELPLTENPPEISGSSHTQKPDPSAIISTDLSSTTSKRWKGIFKKSDDQKVSNKVKEKKREKKNSISSGGSPAELNINIWPFSRSRSAGNGGTRPKPIVPSIRKVSSAPCSRSNSAGESKSRKWPSSPSRGVHLGRNSPVWQVRSKSTEKGLKKDVHEGHRKLPPAGRGTGGSGSTKPRVLTLNVPMCIGYRNRFSCKSDENSAVSIAASGGHGGGVSVEGVRGSNFLNIRGLFSKKVY